LVYNNNNVMFS